MDTETNDDAVVDNGLMDEISAEAAKEAARAANKPVIDHLPDAIEKDEMGFLTLLAGAGEKIIIERIATVLSHRPWLDTKTYTIESVDAVSGRLALWDDELHRNATSNFIEGLKAGYRFKLVTKKGMQIGARRRGRPRKNPTGAPEEAKPVQLDANGQPVAKRRGRPPGAKNRSREEIMAAKRAKLERNK